MVGGRAPGASFRRDHRRTLKVATASDQRAVEKPTRPMQRVVKTYRNLSSEKIIETLAVLGERINQRFPNSGLYLVCEELVQMAKHTSARAEAIARPVLWLRLLLAAVAVASAFAVYRAACVGDPPARLRSSWRASCRASRPTVNLVIIAGRRRPVFPDHA